MSRVKIIIRFVIILILIILASFLFYKGYYYNNLAKPKTIFSNFIDEINNKLINYYNLDKKYEIGDNFAIEGETSFGFSSEKYLANSIDQESLEKYHIINNLNNTRLTYNLMQNKSSKQLYFASKGTIGNELVFNNKYLVENSTKYYFLENILNTYVNDGSCNYFENLNNDVTSKENVDYLYNFIINSLKNNLNENKITKYEVTEKINNEDVNVYQISMTIDDNFIRNLLNNILNDLKHDNRANSILTNIDKDFSKTKISNKKFFVPKNESYVLNIFVNKFLYKPLKYQLIHLNNKSKETLSYEISNNGGDIYYLSNESLKFIGKVTYNNKNISINFLDSNKKNIGTFKYNKSSNGFNFNLLFNQDNKAINLVFSSKFINYNKDGYSNEMVISFKRTDNLINVLSGDIKISNKISKKVKINEDVSTAVLSSSLTEEQINNKTNQFTNIKERYKR